MTRVVARWLPCCMRQSWHALRSPRTAPWSGASGAADAGGRGSGRRDQRVRPSGRRADAQHRHGLRAGEAARGGSGVLAGVSGPMYDGYKLCDRLTASEICLVVEQYEAGNMLRKFHEHVPRYRLSREARTHLLRMLVFHFSGVGAHSIVSSSLNQRAKSPAATPLPYHVSYPEPGVMRTYFGANTTAWSDQVVNPDNFRQLG